MKDRTEKVYRQCLKLERDRERKWRSAKKTHAVRNTFRLVDFEKAEAAEEIPPVARRRGAVLVPSEKT